MKKNLAVIGGDLRIVKLTEMLAKEKYSINTYGLELAESLKNKETVKECKTLEEAIFNSDVVIGPIPLSSNKVVINMPFSDKTVKLEEIKELLKNKTFIAGAINTSLKKEFEDANIPIIDILEREEFAILNTISTAEGAIQIAMEETTRTIHGSNVLIMGFGRVGKMLAKILDGIGAKVSCEARKNSDIAWIKAYGYENVNLNDIDNNLWKYDIIINTIPFVILTEQRLSLLKKECIIIDLASNPGGVDKKAVKEQGIKLIWALSLPGKVAPLTTAEFIKETIQNILKEM